MIVAIQQWFAVLIWIKKEVEVYWSDLERYNEFKFECPQAD